MEDWQLKYLQEHKKTLEARAQVLQLQYNKVHEEIQETAQHIKQYEQDLAQKKEVSKKKVPKGKKK